jgi:hypothetical protein
MGNGITAERRGRSPTGSRGQAEVVLMLHLSEAYDSFTIGYLNQSALLASITGSHFVGK